MREGWVTRSKHSNNNHVPLSLQPIVSLTVVSHFPSSPQGYRQKDSYIASQGPLQHTLEDFWRMIWEWRSCSIVMLTELEERGQVGPGEAWRGVAAGNNITMTQNSFRRLMYPKCYE